MPNIEGRANPGSAETQAEIELAANVAVEEAGTNADAPAQEGASIPDRNIIRLRGIIAAIQQSYNLDTARRQVITTITNVINTPDGKQPVRVDVTWGGGDRATAALRSFAAGDHVEVTAEAMYYYNPRMAYGRNILFGQAIKKTERGGVLGMGDYPADTNECVFVAELTRVIMPSDESRYGRITLVYRDGLNGRTRNLSFSLNGASARILRNNEQYAKIGSKIGVACHVGMRRPSGDRPDPVVVFYPYGFIFFDESGNRITVPLPERRPYRIPVRRDVQPRNVVIHADDRDELMNMSREDQHDREREEEVIAAGTAPEKKTDAPEDALERNMRKAAEQMASLDDDDTE